MALMSSLYLRIVVNPSSRPHLPRFVANQYIAGTALLSAVAMDCANVFSEQKSLRYCGTFSASAISASFMPLRKVAFISASFSSSARR